MGGGLADAGRGGPRARRGLSYTGLLVLVFAMGVAQEALMTFRMRLRQRRAKERAEYSGPIPAPGGEGGLVDTAAPLLARREPQLRLMGLTGLYGLNLLLSYLLMLAAMTYNVGIFLAAILGLCAGHHAFYRDPTDAHMDHGLECCPSE